MSQRADVLHAPRPTLRAPALHETLVRLHRIGSPTAGPFALALRAMSLSGLYRELGFASFLQYAMWTFGCSYFQIREYLRVARALGFLPFLRVACEDGTIEWPKLAAIVAVARPEDEERWLELAATQTLPELRRSVREAIERQARRRSPYAFQFPGGYTDLQAGAIDA